MLKITTFADILQSFLFSKEEENPIDVLYFQYVLERQPGPDFLSLFFWSYTGTATRGVFSLSLSLSFSLSLSLFWKAYIKNRCPLLSIYNGTGTRGVFSLSLSLSSGKHIFRIDNVYFQYVLEQQPGGFSLTLSLSSEKHMFRIDILYFRATLQPMSKITRYAYVLQQRII